MGEGTETSEAGGMRNWEKRLVRRQLQSDSQIVAMWEKELRLVRLEA